eukprot:XP_011661388.1 PREDICTED: uncharacterized protein LOC762824 [Strongylocentrotus purpuratus]
MKKYNELADLSFDSVSRSGFGEMLIDWRRRVRPSEQVDELHLALQNAGLGHAAEVILQDRTFGRRNMTPCTPYIPETVERGKEIEVHLHLHADLPGIETNIQEEEKQQSYHKIHRSVPFGVESKSGHVTVTCQHEGKQVESKDGKIRHNILLSVTSPENDVEFTEITITQAGRLGVPRSTAFIIRHTGIRHDNGSLLNEMSSSYITLPIKIVID